MLVNQSIIQPVSQNVSQSLNLGLPSQKNGTILEGLGVLVVQR